MATRRIAPNPNIVNGPVQDLNRLSTTTSGTTRAAPTAVRPGELTPITAPTPTPAAPAPSPARAPTPATPPAPGTLDTPGAGEQFWEQNQGKWTAPTESAQNWEGLNGYFAAPSWKPETTTSAYDDYAAKYGEPQEGTVRAGDISKGLLETGYGEGGLKNLATDYYTPTDSETYQDQTSGYFKGPGAGEDYLGSHLGQYDVEGDAETNYGEAVTALDGINYGDKAVDMVGAGADKNVRTSDAYGGLQDYFGSNPIEDEYAHFSEGLRGPSNSETLYDSGKGEGGLTTYFGREQMKAQRKLDDAMAARGLFGGEASIRGSIELGADFGAQQAKAMSDMAQRADEARLARTGEARQFTTAGAAEGRLRRGQGIDMATAADKLGQDQDRLGLDALTFASGEGLDKVRVKTDAADKSQGRQLERQADGMQGGIDLQELEEDRIELGGTIANDSSTNRLNRLGDLEKLFVDTDDATNDRLELSANMGMDADAADLNRGDKLFDNAEDLDRLNLDGEKFGLDKVQAGADIAAGVDTTNLAFVNSGATAAGNTQIREEARERGGLEDIMDVTDSMAGGFTGQMDGMLSDYAATEEQKIQAMLDSGQISAEGAAAKRAQIQSTITEMGKMFMSMQGGGK